MHIYVYILRNWEIAHTLQSIYSHIACFIFICRGFIRYLYESINRTCDITMITIST